ncbi:Calcium/calmodulin-dependent 3',5'-cyclic nucleotide phosphodiesterase 1C [Cichlidogyrus casuarinus]|uniref:Calcium/calmodulin-dependent 3',5'-cyclic nucleotide phosphodiesterase 1C n=1 Tax=Cichlidogyrus casuarinus TaxID=1844966 RepID=A0ABD2PTH0_9PLAT
MPSCAICCRNFRFLTIEMVLNTDMSTHFQQIKIIKSQLANNEMPDHSKGLSLLLHCADISHPSKLWELHHPWTTRLLEEFFRQGDRERELGLPFSPLCDRNTTLIAESQIGFIDFIVEPSFHVLTELLESMLWHAQNRSAVNGTTKVACMNHSSSQSSVALHNPSPTDDSNQETKKSKMLVERPWESEIQANRALWKKKAETEVLPSQQKPEEEA